MFLFHRMPERIWTLSKAHDVGQLVRVRCRLCPGWRRYQPDDLRRLLGDVDVHGIARRMRCERCGRRDEMQAEVFIPVASERMRLTVRRLVGEVRKVAVWRDE